MSDDYPDRNIIIAFKNFKSKYMARLVQTLSKLHKAFYQSRLHKQNNPDVYMMYM
jgi:hypothetical protein